MRLLFEKLCWRLPLLTWRFYAGSLKALWLADSLTMLTLAGILGWIAAKPSAGTRPILMLIAFIPASTALLLYTFLGNFFPGHLMLLIALLVFVAALQFPRASLIEG
jgi:hypothetical protein